MSNTEEVAEPKRGFSLFWFLYGQITSVMGAFALIVLLSHVVHVDWRGLLYQAVNFWLDTIRPAVKFLFDVSVVAFVKWMFGVAIEVPLVVRDYFAVSLTFVLALVRAIGGISGTYRLWRAYPSVVRWRMPGLFFSLLLPRRLFLMSLFAWPAQIVITLQSLLKDGHSVANMMYLAPGFYLIALLALNYFVLGP